jgi:heme oxygenase
VLANDVAVLAGLFPGPTVARDDRGPGPALSRPAVLGCLYTIEGATLGGRELGRRLEPALHALGLEGLDGRRFFHAYDTRQGDMWRRFCAVLADAACDFTPAEHWSMEQAALDLFLSLEDWLTRSAA